jgi:hypothetical protein
MLSVDINRIIQLLGFWLLLVSCTTVSSEAQTVYITKSGSKYHAEGCRYLKSSKIPVTLKVAKEQGYGACSVCSPETDVKEDIAEEPDTVTAPAPLIRHSSKSKSEAIEKTMPSPSSQCSAFTKAGARCKRAPGANGKCWQHQ